MAVRLYEQPPVGQRPAREQAKETPLLVKELGRAETLFEEGEKTDKAREG